MNPVENKLRAALRETAGDIPAAPPPLRLSPLGTGRDPVSRRHARRLTWTAPLAAAAAVVALVAATLVLVHGGPDPGGLNHGAFRAHRVTSAPPGPDGVPRYYVALVSKRPPFDPYQVLDATAEVRATVTGTVLDRVTPPRPYASFSYVTAAADDRTFVLAAQEAARPGRPPSVRLFMLNIGPAGDGATLRALPAGLIPPHVALGGLALSDDGTLLAADVGGTQLSVFNLATGTSRSWAYREPGHAALNLAFTFVVSDPLSWTADGRHLAYIGTGGQQGSPRPVWLLDVTAPGSDLAASSRPVAAPPPGYQATSLIWREARVTPDGRSVLAVEGLKRDDSVYITRTRLLKISVATGRVTVVNDVNQAANPDFRFEQVLYANGTGSTLIIGKTGFHQSTGILRGNRYTPIPWSRYIAAAAW